jgi:ribosomal-protein-alanine N-acetyltransferase
VQIRRATPEDIPQLIELERISDSAAHWTLRQYRDLFEAQRPMLLLAAVEEGGRMLGFLVARGVGAEWELENIAVLASERRKGIGGVLMQGLVDAARQARAEAIFLEVRQSNQAARGLYEDVGLRESGVRKRYYTAPTEDAILYRMDLQ